ncbi:MAG: lamin tail domain-containing protein [Phycisphaerales bacterium]|nr:MAG: lamin tail domain-containing protein [Phycisphaerales bacterium]
MVSLNIEKLLALLVLVAGGLVAATADGGWIAYNDCLREPGDATAANVTGWTIHSRDLGHFTGPLEDFETGSDVGMPTVTFTMGGAGLQVSGGGAGGNPAFGTDAHEIFGDIVDFGPNTVYYGSPGWWVEIEFTGLDPAKTYTFVGTAIRSTSYPKRISLFTIAGAASFVNNSSDGVVEKDEDTTKLLAGDNSITGYVVRWDEIVPAADGSFKVRAEATTDSDGGRAYPFGGFMLQELGKAGNRPPEVDAGDYDPLTWPIHTLRLSPLVEDDDPCGYGILTYKWSQLSGPGTVTFLPSEDIEDPCAVFSEPGDYQLQLQVWDEVPQEGSGSVLVTVIMPLLGDFNGDRKVNFKDIVVFAAQWLDPYGSPADLNAKDGVNGFDFDVLAKNWRAGEGATLVINEFLARNDLNNKDPQGEYEDWIEIYNAGEDAVDIGGMYLTDDLSEPTKWRIPVDDPAATTLPPGGYLLIWADNDVTDPGLHAAFELSDTGDEIGLFDTDGVTVLDSVTFGEQTPDVSYGRDPDAIAKLVTLSPTPGASNNGSYLGVVADTKFSHDRGFYDAPFSVTITTETQGATIRYTTDCSTPSERHGTPYAGPISIGTTTCLRAFAFKQGCKSTNVDTHTYIFLDDVIAQATHPTTGAQVTPDGYAETWDPGPGDGSYSNWATSDHRGDYQVDPDVVGQNGKDKFGGLYAVTIKDDLKSVPTISLVMNKDDWFGSQGLYIHRSLDHTERAASFELIDPNGTDQIQANCAMSMQGGGSGGGTSLSRWKSYKLSMRPRFKPQTDDGKPTGGPPKLNFKLFPDSPVDRHNTFLLDAVLNHSWLHPGAGQRNTAMYIQDQYVADLHNAMGGYSPHGFYAHTYINGLYWGMYYVHERPDDPWAAEIFGGDEAEYDALKHNSGNVLNNGTGGSATANYNAMVNAANAVQSDPTNLAKYNTLCEMLDVDNFIAYLLANWFTDNGDWPHKNWYATHRNHPDGRWRFHSWDAEHTVEDNRDGRFGQSPSDIHGKLDNSAEYRMRFADHVHRNFFNGGPLSYPNTANAYQARMNQIDRAIVGESARWGDNRQSTPYTRQNWLSTQNGKLTGLFPGRSAEVLGRLRNINLYPDIEAPVFNINGSYRHGGHISAGDLLTMAAADIVWYTLDGADPRLPGGAVNVSHAAMYSGALSLTETAHVKARVRSRTTWSALNEATFAVGPVSENLRITEIMYHPYDAGDPNDPNTEFIELTNIGSQTINLNLVKFTNGVEFTFPSMELSPDQYVLVVKDADAFAAKYGQGHNIAGQYTGSLNNNGERVELQDAAGTTIHNFRYRDGWYDITDGLGFSLTVRNPASTDPNRWSDKSTWRPSANVDGSPDADDTGLIPELGDVVINEILAHSHAAASDWIELHNTTDHAINIGGWFLSDDADNLKKYEIAEGTTIMSGGYFVLTEGLHFGNRADPGCHVPFALSENGETLYLHSGRDRELTGYSEQEKFGASVTGVAFGRYQKSTGAYNFVAMSVNTPGSANAYPKVGPIVISEIMYHPDSPADAEYVELLNMSEASVTLYDFVTSEPWRFTDDPDNPGIEFLFPSDPLVTVASGECILMVKDPSMFSSKYTAPEGTQIFAWGAGRLDNGGEKIQISLPGDVDTDGVRRYIRVDRVRYSDGSHPDDFASGVDPWPTGADGSGSSLTRLFPQYYGNDPNNWQAATPSPGIANP